MTRLGICARLLLGVTVAGCATAQTGSRSTADKQGPAWEAVRAATERAWAKTYPAEKVLNIEKKGDPDYKQEYGGSTTSVVGSASFSWDDWSTSYNETRTTREQPKGFFLRQLALVTVERANHSRARFTVAAIFRRSGNNWDFTDLATSTERVEELGGGADVPAPPAPGEAQKIFFETAQKRCAPEYKIASVKLEGDPKLGRSGKNFWYDYTIILDGDAGAGKKVHCKVKEWGNALRWNADAKRWDPDSLFGCTRQACDVE